MSFHFLGNDWMNAWAAGSGFSPRRNNSPEWIGRIWPGKRRAPTRTPRVTAPFGISGTIASPRPASTVRVLVGRCDFLTPEQKAEVERRLSRVRAAQAESVSADRELAKFARFARPACDMAQRWLESRGGPP